MEKSELVKIENRYLSAIREEGITYQGILDAQVALERAMMRFDRARKECIEGLRDLNAAMKTHKEEGV